MKKVCRPRPRCIHSGVPVLGICYGMQTMAAQLGGQVEGASHREFGAAQIRPVRPSPLLDGLEDNRDAQGQRVLDVWMSHGDRVTAIPPGFSQPSPSATMRRSPPWLTRPGACMACSSIRR